MPDQQFTVRSLKDSRIVTITGKSYHQAMAKANLSTLLWQNMSPYQPTT